ncbi:MAG: SDR family oxidoreductase [candidate division Zixibacteria bacterium]|nr:SDR family oxidoreductase [candidate division Zixibacteria bacterium]
MRLNGKVAIITGTGDGIGRGIAVRFAREGASVAVCDVNGDAVAETGRLIKTEGRPVFVETLDITDHAGVRAFVDRVVQRFGRLDILVNNAAVMPVGSIEEQDETVMDRIVRVNLVAPAVFSKYCAPHMRRSGGGSILHMASVTGHNGFPGVALYGATKGGLIALARGQAMELAPYGIRVNTVSPGTVDSPMLHNFIREHADDPEAARRAFDAIHPIGRVATIDEVASVFVFLASDEASDITAADIRCDGGFSVQGRQPRS